MGIGFFQRYSEQQRRRHRERWTSLAFFFFSVCCSPRSMMRLVNMELVSQHCRKSNDDQPVEYSAADYLEEYKTISQREREREREEKDRPFPEPDIYYLDMERKRSSLCAVIEWVVMHLITLGFSVSLGKKSANYYFQCRGRKEEEE